MRARPIPVESASVETVRTFPLWVLEIGSAWTLIANKRIAVEKVKVTPPVSVVELDPNLSALVDPEVFVALETLSIDSEAMARLVVEKYEVEFVIAVPLVFRPVPKVMSAQR